VFLHADDRQGVHSRRGSEQGALDLCRDDIAGVPGDSEGVGTGRCRGAGAAPRGAVTTGPFQDGHARNACNQVQGAAPSLRGRPIDVVALIEIPHGALTVIRHPCRSALPAPSTDQPHLMAAMITLPGLLGG
jgi:hypothetical protein